MSEDFSLGGNVVFRGFGGGGGGKEGRFKAFALWTVT